MINILNVIDCYKVNIKHISDSSYNVIDFKLAWFYLKFIHPEILYARARLISVSWNRLYSFQAPAGFFPSHPPAWPRGVVSEPWSEG